MMAHTKFGRVLCSKGKDFDVDLIDGLCEMLLILILTLPHPIFTQAV